MNEGGGRSWGPVIAAAVAAAVIVGVAVWYQTRNGFADDGTPRKLAELSPQELERLKQRRQIAYKQVYTGELAAALPELRKLTRSYPDDAESQSLLARALLGLDRPDEAMAAFARVIELDPQAHEAHFNLGVMRHKRGELKPALEHLMTAARIKGDDPRYAMWLAQVEMDLGETAAAKVQLLRALTLDSNLPEAYARLADLAARDANLPAAIDYANKAIELVEGKGERELKYVILKAKLLRRANKPAEALAVLLAQPPADQQQEVMVEQIAASYLMMSEPRKAGAVWAELFAADPVNARAAAEAGLCFHRAGELDAARKYLGYAQRVDPANSTVLSLDGVLNEKPTGELPK